MALQSMTGFARAFGQHDATSITWEVKSVNGKSVEVRLRLPPGFDRIEPPARQGIQRRFSRGNVQATLTLGRAAAGASRPVVDHALLEELVGLAKGLEERYGFAPARADGLLALRGVLDLPDAVEDPDSRAGFDASILATLEAALGELQTARRAEGQALAGVLERQLRDIGALTALVEADPSRDPAAIRERLAEQVRLLAEPAAGLDESRLYMEAAYLATKADIREEIDRLKTHVASGLALVAAGGVVGRKLDFLAQEFNREANTLCSKSNAASVTAIGLELKALVDQFREQVQNLE